MLSAGAALAADLATDLVGSWTMVSHTVSYDGSSFDAHAALLQQRPCAAKIRYLLNADGSYRLDASASGCDDKYRAIQEKLYAKTRWRLEGNKLSTSSTNFAVGQHYNGEARRQAHDLGRHRGAGHLGLPALSRAAGTFPFPPETAPMFSHVMVGSNNIARAKRFYDALLAVLGAGPAFEHTAKSGTKRLFYRHQGASFCVSEPLDGQPATVANGGTIGFKCSSPEQVRQFHDTAVAQGGESIEEPPGPARERAGRALPGLRARPGRQQALRVAPAAGCTLMDRGEQQNKTIDGQLLVRRPALDLRRPTRRRHRLQLHRLPALRHAVGL